MEEKKNNNLLIIILVVLLLIAVGIICYLLGSNNTKENNQNNIGNSTESKENNVYNESDESAITPTSYTPKCVDSFIKSENLLTDIDETKYNNIIEYIKDQKNVKISLWYCRNSDENSGVNYTLTETEKNTAFNEIANNSHYIADIELGGGACVPYVDIKYERNNKEYTIRYGGYIMRSDDGNIYKIIDKTATNTFTQEYCHYSIENLGSTINNITKYELN